MRYTLASVFLAASALAQTAPPPAFEVASVKINEPFLGRDNRWRGSIQTAPGSLTMRRVTWLTMLTWAWQIHVPQIAGGPSWLEIETYDVVAKAGREATLDEMRIMLRALLAERFKLATHRERRELSALVLVEGKGGHKMNVSDSDHALPSVQDPVKGNVVKAISMPELVELIAHELRLPVVDDTGLKGRYDFPLNIREAWERYISNPSPGERLEPVGVYQLLLQQGAGLKLDSRKTPIEVLVIDHIEKNPIEN
jgi:uncharacterized protein (TIGR03435 family)